MTACQQALASGGEPNVSLSNQTYTKGVTSPATATCSYNLLNTGSVTNQDAGELQKWITPQTQESNYEAFVTVTSGSLSAGTAGSWLNLGTNRTWSRVQSTDGSSTVVFTVQIRNAITLLVKTSASISLTAERSP